MNVSDRAKQGFDTIVQHCMRTTLVPSGHEVTGFESLQQVPTQGGVVMLTVASSTFSLVLFLHYDVDSLARQRLAMLHGLDPQTMSEQAFEDALAESGNLLCGALNRELGRVFPLVAMSTPNRLSANSVLHLGLLRHGHVQHFRMRLDDGSHRDASYCVCAYSDVDFTPAAVEQEVNSGELEFF